MSNLDNALRELREKRTRARVEIDKLDQLISGIASLNGTGAATPNNTVQPKRIISAASRRKMALAQKARWASIRKKSQPIAVVAKSAMLGSGKAHHVRISTPEDRGGTKSTVGEDTGAGEEGGLVAYECLLRNLTRGYGFGCEVRRDLCGCLTGTACVELLTSPNPFLLSE